MRQYRLRTIMALIVIIAVSIWVGMLIEWARRPARRAGGLSVRGFFQAQEQLRHG
jgi:hypothetical protein